MNISLLRSDTIAETLRKFMIGSYKGMRNFRLKLFLKGYSIRWNLK